MERENHTRQSPNVKDGQNIPTEKSWSEMEQQERGSVGAEF